MPIDTGSSQEIRLATFDRRMDRANRDNGQLISMKIPRGSYLNAQSAPILVAITFHYFVSRLGRANFHRAKYMTPISIQKFYSKMINFGHFGLLRGTRKGGGWFLGARNR